MFYGVLDRGEKKLGVHQIRLQRGEVPQILHGESKG